MPKLRFPGFSGEWEEHQFNDLFSILPNNTLSRAELTEKGEIKNVHYGDVLIKFGDILDAKNDNIPFVRNTMAIQKNVIYLINGDIIIADTAEDDTVGKATELFNVNEVKVVSGLHTIPCRPRKTFASKYLGYYMNSLHYHKQLSTLMQGIKVLSISKTNIAKTVVHCPKIDEQKVIAAFLSLLDERITKQRELVENLKSYKRGALSKLFPQKGQRTPECRFEMFTDPWEQHELGEVASFSKGNGYSKCDIIKEGTPIILYGRLYTKYETVINNVDTFAEEKKGAVYSTGREVVVPASGETAEDIARAAHVAKPGILLGGDLNIVTPNDEIDPTFLALIMSYGEQQKNLSKKAQGKSVVHIHNSDFETLKIFTPKIKEQEQISAYFMNLEHIINLHQYKSDELLSLKNTMLQQLFI